MKSFALKFDTLALVCPPWLSRASLVAETDLRTTNCPMGSRARV